MQLVAARPGFALAANKSVTVGADTAAKRPSFFNSARRCLSLLDFALPGSDSSLLSVLAMWIPRYVVSLRLRLATSLSNTSAVTNPANTRARTLHQVARRLLINQSMSAAKLAE